jgi:hypothetical protein
MSLIPVSISWSTVIDAPISAVWNTVRTFSDLAWLGFSASVQGGGPDNQVGETVRVVTVGDKAVRERLVTLSDESHVFEYRILMETPEDIAKNLFDATVHGYKATFELQEVKDGNRTFARWSTSFETEVEKAEMMKETLLKLAMQGGLEKLRDSFKK